ncbi:hypothetical protein As57867_001844, partial [Aphanomyces stellatus]
MNASTYDLLNAMSPGTRTTVNIGYDLTNATISSDSAECIGSGGAIKEIFTNKAGRTTIRGNETYKKMVFTVCVLGTGLSSTAIAGIVAGSVVVVLGLLAWYFWQKRKYNSGLSVGLLPEGANDEEKLDMRELTLYRLPETDIQVASVLGSGAFANVWLGTFQGKPVAVKKLHQNRVNTLQLQSFMDEIQLMSTFESPFIVKLIGAAWTRPMDLQCVMEYMDSGDLRDYLISHDHQTFGWDEKVVHIQRIAEGLVYLHSLNIIHRDLK